MGDGSWLLSPGGASWGRDGPNIWNISTHHENPLTGQPMLPWPCPLVVDGGVDPVASLSPEVTAGCKICQQLAVTKIEPGNAYVDRLPQKGGDEMLPFRFPFR